MIVERQAVRAILITPRQEVLLMSIHPPQGGDSFWICPGGGLEAGESHEAGLRRELREELGLLDFALGPLLWRRQHSFCWGDRFLCQSEHLYAVSIPHFEPRITDAVEARILDRFEWWPLDRLQRTAERLTPAPLARIVRDYLLLGPPEQMPEIEIVNDL